MFEFLKVFLRGIVCTILLPIILLIWVLYGVYCLVTFVVMFINATILFFKGDSFKNDLKEDAEAKKMLEEKQRAAENAQNMMTAMYQTAMAQMQAQTMMQNGIMPHVNGQENIEQNIQTQEPVLNKVKNETIPQNTDENLGEEDKHDGESY